MYEEQFDAYFKRYFFNPREHSQGKDKVFALHSSVRTLEDALSKIRDRHIAADIVASVGRWQPKIKFYRVPQETFGGMPVYVSNDGAAVLDSHNALQSVALGPPICRDQTALTVSAEDLDRFAAALLTR